MEEKRVYPTCLRQQRQFRIRDPLCTWRGSPCSWLMLVGINNGRWSSSLFWVLAKIEQLKFFEISGSVSWDNVLDLKLDASCESVEVRVNSGCPSRGKVFKVHPGRPRYPMVQIGYASEWLDDGEP
ncbi:hypothetical protein QJS10_CPA01g01989 [Acorus calamus]|uniref:Uncharacterized protein n=1 Tax=Acorus calamus TaxID=4465 RepID=A0AAV9FL55_ACOCL|nr:hypothetical protein QJS10_CPA01g01989 [Acorus calamus]